MKINSDSLSALDIKTMKLLGTRCNVIPVIAKADTITPAALKAFKARVHSKSNHITF
jgi:cell division control protein 12